MHKGKHEIEKRNLMINQLLKKVIGMVLVLIMLAGNVASPIISIAEELNASGINTNEIVDGDNEVNNGNEGEEDNVIDPQEDKQTQIDYIEAAYNDAQNNQENQNEGDKTEENNSEGPDQNASRTLRSAPPLRSNGNEPESDKIQDRIKPDKKDEVEIKKKNDAYEINKFETEFVSGAVKDENGNLVYTPESAYSSPNKFIFRVNYALSGLGEHPAEAIKITIPKRILRNRNGDFADKIEMSLPKYEDYDGTTEFVYIEDDDYIMIFNPAPVHAAVNGYIEISYQMSSSCTEYKDYDKTKIEKIVDGGTASDPFNAVITVKTTVNEEEDILADVSDDKSVFINTTARIVSTQKYQPQLYRDWNDSWMRSVPEDKDDYYYLEWSIVTFIEDPTQPYTFSLQDTITNLTAGTDFDDYQFVGYKLQGENYYSDKNTDDRRSTKTTRTDYVLTRHKKETFRNINYSLKNTVKATVYPIDAVDQDTSAVSSSVFSWSSEFKVPTGHFQLYKYGNNNWNHGYWDYASYDLDKLQSGEVNELDGFKYETDIVGYAYPWTLREGGSSNNPEDYGYNPVTYDTWDDTLYLENDENQMGYEDYYLDFFTYSIYNLDANYDDFYNKFNTEIATYDEDELVTFFGKFEDSQVWVQIGTLNLKNKEIQLDDTYVESMTTEKVKFKDGVHCTGWRYTTTNKHFNTSITVTPYFVLTNSDYVMEKIANKDKIQVKNIVKTNITDYKDETIFSAERSAIDYARVTYYDSHISKIVTASSNNVNKKNYSITWKIDTYETATGGTGNVEYIRHNSGKIYDLIPNGGELDYDSVQVKTERGFLPENEYSYTTIPNYKNSGRTLLIIEIDVQAQYFVASYKTIHSWESMHDFGRSVLNPVAFETGNEKITKGYPDNGGNLSEENKEMFTDLDEESDANKFLYAEEPYNINAITATISGLYKMVKNEKEYEYSYDTKVESGGYYSYKLRYQNTYTNKSKNLILYDSLENFEIINSNEGTVKTSGWRGTLQSIDLNQVKKLGISPVVYVSTRENLNIEEYNDITNEEVWKRIGFTTNLSEVKAIAIDLRKDNNGNDFMLDPGESVSVTIGMKAPEQANDEIEENPFSYNNVYLSGTLLDANEDVIDFLIHQDYTKLKYYITSDVYTIKVNEEDNSERIKDITFRLFGTSIYGTRVDEYISSDKNGEITFKDIEVGEYTLQEYEANDDWFIDYTEHQVQVTREKEVFIDGELVNEMIPYILKNKPRIHTDVTLSKKDTTDENKVLSGVKFKLTGISDYGNELLLYSVSDEDGVVEFKNVEKGTYDLVEVESLEGYISNETKYKVVVDENGNYDIKKAVKKTTFRTEQIEREKTIAKTGYSAMDGSYISHSPNIDDTGYASSNYTSGLSLTDTVTVPGADRLEVSLYYSMGAYYSDWVCLYGENSTPTKSNYDSSISGRLYGNYKSYTVVNNNGYQNECEHNTFTIDGDTVKIFLYTNSKNYYGYYAIITGYKATTEEETVTVQEQINIQEEHEEYESVYNNGNYYIYNEPYHRFYFTKKDEYNYEKLGGAVFRLYGCSNYGHSYNQTATSVAGTGYVTFENLESGTYMLKEITPPDSDETTYVFDNVEHIVEVFEDGRVTLDGNLIWPLVNNETFEWKNKRNKGQITITKRWVDNLTNEERIEPRVYISTKKPTPIITRAYFRRSGAVSSIIDYVGTEESITTFRRNTILSEEEILEKENVVRIDNNWNDDSEEFKIYAWVEDGVMYWWSKADLAILPANLNYYFFNEDALREIDWTGIDTSEYWVGSNDSEVLTSSIESMKCMFFGCKSIRELDISGLNNTGITNPENMEFAFGDNSTAQAGKMHALKYIKIGSNFKLFESSSLTIGEWINQRTNSQYSNTDLVGNISTGTYEYIGVELKYAVQVYGIKQDVDANGNTLGLTFGPAAGDSYLNKYVTHRYEDNGNGTYTLVKQVYTIGEEEPVETYMSVTRTSSEIARYGKKIHDMTWAEIASEPNKDVFTDSMLCGDTKSVKLNLNAALSNGTQIEALGDGTALLDTTIDSYYKIWNPTKSQNDASAYNYEGSSGVFKDGYALSHMRATLVGENEKTIISYAGDVNLTEETCIYSCIESDLQEVITAKQVKYATSKGSTSTATIKNDIADKIWILSTYEMKLQGNFGEGIHYKKFQSLPNDSGYASTERKYYNEAGNAVNSWSRSPFVSRSNYSRIHTISDGRSAGVSSPENKYAISFCFCIK